VSDVPGERFFVPTTAWGASPATRPQPSFLPGETGPAWLSGPAEVREVLLLCDPVLTLLYLAGYEVPVVLLGRGEAAGDWVTFDTSDLRIRPGTGKWSAQVGGANHPGGNKRAVAMQALPMPHRQRAIDPDDAPLAQPIPIDVTVAGTRLDAAAGGWIILDLSPASADTAVVLARQQLLRPVATAVTRFQSARVVDGPPGLSGVYDPTNWRTVVPASGATKAADDVRETLSRVTLRLTGGPWSNDDDPITQGPAPADQVLEFLEADLADPRRPSTELDLDVGWASLELRMNTTPIGIFELDDLHRELADLRRTGADPDLQGLTTTILDLHDRQLVDVLDGFAAATSTTADPCAEATALAVDLDTPLTAVAVAVMCECLLISPSDHAEPIMRRLEDDLAIDYAALFDQPEPRAAIRDSLITACQAANSQNPALNADDIAAPVDSPHAEWFGRRLASVLTSEPSPTMPGFSVFNYANPLLEVGDTWDRWSPLLESLPAGPKLISLTCDVFHDCGHVQVVLAAAARVIDHYRGELAKIWHDGGQPGHHWSHAVYGEEFSGVGSTRQGLEGWSGQLLVSLLTMLANTCVGTEHADLYDDLFELVGPDPLAVYDIEAFEAAYGKLLAGSDTPLVAEYTVLLGLLAGYASATNEVEAGRYNARPLQERFAELAADAAVIGKLEQHRDAAFVSVPNEWLSVDDLQFGIEAFVATPHHQALLLCLDDEHLLAYQETMLERVRRVCPAAAEDVLAVFIGISFAREAASLIDAIDEDDLVTMLDDVAEVHHYKVPSLVQKLAKVLKEGPTGIPKAYYSVGLNEGREQLSGLSVWRRELWGDMLSSGTPDARPTDVAINAYLRVDDETRALARLIDDEFAIPADKAAAAGHVITVFVGGLVLWQLHTDGEPTAPDKILGLSRDLGMAAASLVQIAALAIKYLFTEPGAWVAVVATIGTFLTKLSTFITLLSNGLAMVRYIAEKDHIGAALMFVATGASVVAFVAVAGGLSAPIGAIAATVAAFCAVIDIARGFVIFHLAEKALWDATIGARELLFAPAVGMAAPLDGKVVLTQPLPPTGEVPAIQLGYIEPLAGGNDNSDADDDVVELTIGEGITAMYPVQTQAEGKVFLTSPIPAVVARHMLTDDREREVWLDEVLIPVRPRFESWIVAHGTVFDAVFVEQNQHVAEGDVVATLAGESLRAPHAGTIGAFETLPDSERIRIWATS
jgi:hypothetical protein